MKLIKYKPPLPVVKAVCVGAVLIGLFFVVSGRWAVALCMLLGSYLLEKNLYRCPACGEKLNMNRLMPHPFHCPRCLTKLRD